VHWVVHILPPVVVSVRIRTGGLVAVSVRAWGPPLLVVPLAVVIAILMVVAPAALIVPGVVTTTLLIAPSRAVRLTVVTAVAPASVVTCE
jgi:hypothetical protein